MFGPMFRKPPGTLWRSRLRARVPAADTAPYLKPTRSPLILIQKTPGRAASSLTAAPQHSLENKEPVQVGREGKRKLVYGRV